MKLTKLLLTGAFAVSFLGLTAVAAHAEDLLDSVKQAGVLKIGLEGTYPPFDSRNSEGQLEGFDVDVAKAVAAKLGVKPEFIPTEWSGIIAALQAGKFDVIVNQVTITPQRQQAVDFSQPYTYSAAQLIQRADDKREFNSLDEFKGDKKLGVTLGTNYDQMARAVPGINVQTYPGAPEKLRDLAAKRIDATIDDRLMLPYIIKNSQLPLRPGAILKGANQDQGIPFRKGNPKFAKALDDALTSLKQDGTLKKISMHWFGTDVTQPVAQ
jgi:L-cystine transport system substrate-binding protein